MGATWAPGSVAKRLGMRSTFRGNSQKIGGLLPGFVHVASALRLFPRRVHPAPIFALPRSRIFPRTENSAKPNRRYRDMDAAWTPRRDPPVFRGSS